MTQQLFTLVRGAEIKNILGIPPRIGKHLLSSPLVVQTATSKMFIMEACKVPLSEGEAEIHRTLNDLFLCLEGRIQFVCGGKLTEPVTQQENGELRAKDLQGGDELTLDPGDWLFIPAGTPHKNGCDGTCRLAVIKIKN